MKFIHSYEDDDWCTIAIDPVIKDGIVKIEFIFKNTIGLSRIGIADASCSFANGKKPWEDGNDRKTVRYLSYSGDLDHITEDTERNESYKDGQRNSAIVDMTSNPRKVVFYIDDIEQPNYVIGIPSEIRFWIRIVGSKALQWGKSWE
ncbi:MAG: hypothetical protein EZS28_036719 [Streblomastix strix]|uniref:Uncharacterized protein n=1 Tax=Streblomastix strix TaxID=222440 RepID=A0A5J4UC13_9EUKA|nr:MAG: hypothetical protein EZS28_036719 [Streblomastix strix]